MFDRLIERICGNPLIQPAESMLGWLMEHTNCQMRSNRAQTLLNQLKGQHVHIWQVEQEYHILVISDDPTIGTVLNELTQLETDCQAHAHNQQVPELMHNEEGYLFIARGEHAFIFARLFLALEND